MRVCVWRGAPPARRLGCEAVRFKNRLQGLLDLAWPEYLRHFADLTHPTPGALLERWPFPRISAARRHAPCAWAQPPSSLLVQLARALTVTSDEFLGVMPVRDTLSSKTARLLKRLRRIEELPPADQRGVLKLVDTCLRPGGAPLHYPARNARRADQYGRLTTKPG